MQTLSHRLFHQSDSLPLTDRLPTAAISRTVERVVFIEDPPDLMSHMAATAKSGGALIPDVPVPALSNGSRILTTMLTGLSVMPHNASEGYGESTTGVPCHGIYCYSDSFFYLATAVTTFLAIAGAFGNILTVVAILTSNLRNNINSILICNLSFADSFYCTLLLPLQALSFYNKDWVMGGMLCELYGSVRIWLIGVNMCLLSCIAFYRFLNVVHPQSHTNLSLRPWFTIAVATCWVFPFFFAFAPIARVWGAYSFNYRILQCTFAARGSVSHKVTSITLGYVIPCVFIGVCYSRIGCVVFSSRKRSSRGSVYRRQRAKRESFRLTAMMVLIFLGFLLGTTPYFLINIIDAKMAHPAAHVWSPVLAWVMYSLTPVIYTLMDSKFQAAYRRLLLCQARDSASFPSKYGGDRETSCVTVHHKSPLAGHKKTGPSLTNGKNGSPLLNDKADGSPQTNGERLPICDSPQSSIKERDSD